MQVEAVLGLFSLALASYAPYPIECPSEPLVRTADSLCEAEQNWVLDRQQVVRPALLQWLSDSYIDVPQTLGDIRIGVALSGGGYRAMLSGAGQLSALDSRTDNAMLPGGLGGLLDATTYVSALSGGSWLLTSLVANGWASVQQLQRSPQVWNLATSFVASPTGGVASTVQYWSQLLSDVTAKSKAGFTTTFTDYYARGLANKLFLGANHADNTTWSSIQSFDQFASAQMPMPLIVANLREPGTAAVPLDTTVIEMTPFELGSWDPSLAAFANMSYLGSNIVNGQATTCVNNFDNVGFLTATSSSIFNQIIPKMVAQLPSWISSRVPSMPNSNLDIAKYSPNPFFSWQGGHTPLTQSMSLDLCDGGEDGEGIPLYPLLQPERKVDVILAFDNSADTDDKAPYGANFPDGSSMWASQMRQQSKQSRGHNMPLIADQATFIHGGLVEQPTFFGCNEQGVPLIVYMANSHHSYGSNTTTFKLVYSPDERDKMIANGYNVATQNSGTLDPDWRSCLACAVVLRDQQRQGVSPTDQCQACFTKYCWDGNLASSGSGRRDGQSNLC